MEPEDIAGSITWADKPGEYREVCRVMGDGRVFVDGAEVSPAMAENALRRCMSGDELERALAYLRKLTTVN